MSELVDKQEVLKVIREMPYIGLGEKEALLDAIKGMPTEVVVRCKDCEYGEQDKDGRWYCGVVASQIGDADGSGFCADGKRRQK